MVTLLLLEGFRSPFAESFRFGDRCDVPGDNLGWAVLSGLTDPVDLKAGAWDAAARDQIIKGEKVRWHDSKRAPSTCLTGDRLKSIRNIPLADRTGTMCCFHCFIVPFAPPLERGISLV